MGVVSFFSPSKHRWKVVFQRNLNIPIVYAEISSQNDILFLAMKDFQVFMYNLTDGTISSFSHGISNVLVGNIDFTSNWISLLIYRQFISFIITISI